MAAWWLLVLTLAGAAGAAGAAGVSVTYPPDVCAVRGSTVTLLCSFTPVSIRQGGLDVPVKIIRVVWCQNHLICQGVVPSVYNSDSTNNNPRYKYLGDKQGNCSLQISDVQKDDDAELRFRMEAQRKEGCFTGQQGVRVRVVDVVQMKISSSRGGRTLTLLCTADCSVHQLEVTWFRDGHALSQSGPALRLGPLTAKDSGNYTCGLKIYSSSLSLPYSLHVEPEDEGADGGSADSHLRLVFFALHSLLLIIVAAVVLRRTCQQRS